MTSTNSNTAADTAARALDVTATYDQCEHIAAMVYDDESAGELLTRLIEHAKEAKVAADAAAERLAEVRQRILDTMDSANLSSIQTVSGTAKVAKGRRTVSVTDKALAAEITAIKERGVRTGRCTEKIGANYVIIK